MQNTYLKTKTVSFNLPIPKVSVRYPVTKTVQFFKIFFLRIKSSIENFMLRFEEKRSASLADRQTRSRLSIFRRLPQMPYKKISKYLILVLLVLTIVYSAVKIIGGRSNAEVSKEQVMGAKASQDINKELTFPLTNGDGENISSFKYVIENAELRDEIVVQGKKATAIEGRTFLLITLKVTNEYNQAIKINTRNYIRLSVNGNGDEWLAPDIHNDPVEVQAISTKNTRVGFPINDSDTNLILKVGEIEGNKEDIPLELK